MAAHIEWVIEELESPETDGEVEIINVDHADTYREALSRTKGLEHFRIGLVRDAEGHNGGRSWAYVVADRLPDSFLDAYGEPTVATPARYRAQVELAVAVAADAASPIPAVPAITVAVEDFGKAMARAGEAARSVAMTMAEARRALDGIPQWRIRFRRNRRRWLSLGVFLEGDSDMLPAIEALEAQGYRIAQSPANDAARATSL